MCERFHCLPSEVYAEDAELLRLLKIEALARREGEPDGNGDFAAR